MIIETKQVNEVENILKYSKVIFQDGNNNIILKGAVGDYVNYPSFPLEKCDENIVNKYYCQVFNSFSDQLSKFKEEDTTVNINRDLIVIPKTVNWNIGSKDFYVESDIKLHFTLRYENLSNYLPLTTIDFVISNNVYKYTITINEFQGYDVESVEIPCKLYVYTDDNKINEILCKDITINIVGSTNPEGD